MCCPCVAVVEKASLLTSSLDKQVWCVYPKNREESQVTWVKFVLYNLVGNSFIITKKLKADILDVTKGVADFIKSAKKWIIVNSFEDSWLKRHLSQDITNYVNTKRQTEIPLRTNTTADVRKIWKIEKRWIRLCWCKYLIITYC